MSNKRSFTLIEVIVAIFLITVGAGAAYSLIQRTIAFSSVSSGQLISAYLAQEGIEIVRNIRDSNWLEKRTDPDISWDEGLSSGNHEAYYNDLTLTSWEGSGRFLNIDLNNFYSYDISDNPTKFKRKITLSKPEADILEIRVEVLWSEHERTHRTTAQENLYNWLK